MYKTIYDYSVAVPKALFPHVVLLKAAYSFLDLLYIHFDETDTAWQVNMTRKSLDTESKNYAEEFENELLAQAVRYDVYLQTHTVRELLVARAMTTTMVDEADPFEKISTDEKSVSSEELNEILTDWFKHNEKQN